MERLENVATPATADTVLVPDSVPPPGLVPMATVTLAVALGPVVTVLLNWSCTVTRTGEMDTPAVAFVGWVVNASFAAAAWLMLNAVDAAAVSGGEAAVRVYPVPTLSMERLEKVATPFTADTVVVPDSVPAPGLIPMATVTLAVELGPVVTVLLNVSCTVTCTADEMDTPATASDGWTVKASFEAAAWLMLNADEAAPVSEPDAAVSVYP